MRYIQLSVLVAALVVVLLTPAASSAAVRTVTINDGVDMQDTSPGFMPAARLRELVAVSVNYDDATGTITASATFNDPTLRNVGLSLGQTCDEDEQPILSLGTERDERTPDGTLVELTRPGFRDSLTAPVQVSPDGTTISATFTSPLLSGLDLRCVYGSSNADAGVEHPRKLYLSGTAGAPVHKGYLRWTGWGKSVARTQRTMLGLEYIGPKQSVATGRYHYFRGYIRVYRPIDYDDGQPCSRFACRRDRLYTRVRYVFDHRPPRRIGRATRFSGAGPWNVELCEATYPCNN